MLTAVYGGTFDPIHTGHAIVAQYVCRHAGIDSLWIMPGKINPLKVGASPRASDADRLAMARLVAERIPAAEVCDYELSLPPGPSYTIDTLLTLKCLHPERDFRVVIGADNWEVIDRWRDHERIISEFGFIICPRPGYEIDVAALPPNVTYLPEAPKIEISSTFIRSEAAEGAEISFYVPTEVADYIESRKLYRTEI